jgi:hypothetical protein
MTETICRIVRFNVETERDRMCELWDIASDAEVIKGSEAAALGLGTYVWYRVYFTEEQHHKACARGLVSLPVRRPLIPEPRYDQVYQDAIKLMD